MTGLLALGLPGGTAIATGSPQSSLVRFSSAPFPYDGPMPNGEPFLDVRRNGRRGHTSPRGGLYWENETYSDSRVLLSVPSGFDPGQAGVMVVFFHGNGATLERDVMRRQRVPDQVAAARQNAVLVAPQLARDALDSSAGGFWRQGSLARFLDEAAGQLAGLTGAERAVFARMPVVIIAYSGGYNPAAFALSLGGAEGRVRGVVLLDALVGEVDRFGAWIRDGRGFFLSAYGEGSAAGNAELAEKLERRGVEVLERAPERLRAGTVALVPVSGVGHADFVTRALGGDPVTWVLDRVG